MSVSTPGVPLHSRSVGLNRLPFFESWQIRLTSSAAMVLWGLLGVAAALAPLSKHNYNLVVAGIIAVAGVVFWCGFPSGGPL